MKCDICGKEIEKSKFYGAILCSGECFTKLYWRQIIERKHKHIIIDGWCYQDGGDVSNPSREKALGCSGRRFWIRFLDGKEITTNNLWVQGAIPEEFRNELPDTAVFYEPEHIKFANTLI